MALPPLARNATSTLCGDYDGLVIYEKNTFISAMLPSSQPRRASVSVPAGFKVATRGLTSDAREKKRDMASLPKLAFGGDVSTGTTVCLSDCDACSDFESSSGSSQALSAIEELGPKVHAFVSSRPKVHAHVRLSDLISPPVFRPRPALGATARMFASPSTSALGSFYKQVDAMVSSMQSAVSSTGLLASIWSTQSADGWAVCGRLHAETQYASSLIAIAKSALAKGCEQSASVYMLGYLAKPFTDTVSGFSVTLCGMGDEEAACWDYYSKGTCRRGCACRWTHPSDQVTVSIDLRC